MRAGDLGAVDRSVDPCVDFYRFTCNQWMAEHPIPPDRSRFGRFDEVTYRNELILRDILEKAAAGGAGRNAGQQKIGDFYAACTDEAAVDARGIEVLAPDLDRIAALASSGEVALLLAHLHSIGVDAFFRMGADQDPHHAPLVVATVDQGGFGLPDRDDYTRADNGAVQLRAQYLEHVERMLALSGLSAADAATDAADAVRIEKALAAASLGRVARRDPAATYHDMTVAELQAASPGFDWARYFAETGAPPFDRLVVRVPAFASELSALLAAEPLPAIQAYLRWRLIDNMAPFLSADAVAEDFDFHGKTLRGTRELRPRWKRCVSYTDGLLGEALGQPFVERTFGADAKARTEEMVRNLEKALHDDIESLDWMTLATRQRALAKLAAIADKIGYPDRWRDYSALQVIRGDLAGNVQRGASFELHRQLGRIGKAADRKEWDMTPPTVNAYYDPEQNSITFPAGILAPPFYDPHAAAAVNLGGIGGVIGHELTHGFDDEGRKYDAQGNLRDWWTAADGQAFDERAQCFIDQYGELVAVDDVHVDGRLTLGENIADNGGLRLALMALHEALGVPRAEPVDPTAAQRLFVSWGQTWCQNATPETARLLALTDPHSPARYRVNAVVSNMPEFAEAFACKAGQPMVRADPCRIW